MTKIVPPLIIMGKEIDNCVDCRFFRAIAGWDGEYLCELTTKEIKYSLALEEIDSDCPLENVEEEG